jgi:hypothetical protein
MAYEIRFGKVFDGDDWRRHGRVGSYQFGSYQFSRGGVA